MSTLSLSLLGPFQALLDKRPLPKFRTFRVKALLIYLTMEATQQHQRDALMALLWPEVSQEAAQVNLRQTLYQLRKIIPELNEKSGDGTAPFLLVDRKVVVVNTAVSFHIDVTTFTSLLDKVSKHDHPNLLTCDSCQEKLTQAVASYRGDFLADFYLADSANFADWALSWREMLRRLMLEALDTLTRMNKLHNAFSEAEKNARRQLEIDNLCEPAHRQLMEILARSGNRSAAISHYQTCCQILQNELGTDPSAKTQALNTAILAGTLDQAATPSHKELSQYLPQHNLPLQPTPFIGREAELAALTELLDTLDVRLITIVGSGGMGKTRLALALAEKFLQSTSNFANGIFFVPLAGIGSVAH
ncbi:MAG: transcriptional regulator, partial [Chloroflexi bacterium]